MPERVIREAVVNAVMHRSYRIHGAIQIIRYTNGLDTATPAIRSRPRTGSASPAPRPAIRTSRPSCTT